MGKRVLMAVVVTVFSVSSDAAGPLLRRGRAAASRPGRASTPSITPYSYRNLLDSPQKMTELFGPSILVRTQSTKPSKFVTQPGR